MKDHLTRVEQTVKKDLYHAKTIKIKCIECKSIREIFVQDKHHVKRCKLCQKRYRKKRYKLGLLKRIKAEKVKQSAPKERANDRRRARVKVSKGSSTGQRSIENRPVPAPIQQPADKSSNTKIVL